MRPLRVVAGAVLALTVTVAVAQDAAAPTRSPGLKDGEIKRYEQLADIPETYHDAIKKVGCKLDDTLIRDAPPFVFYLPQTGSFLVANCRDIIGHGFVFSLDRRGNIPPEPVLFPVLGAPAGIGTSSSPGWIEWNPESKTLTATRANDFCPSAALRSTYRYGSNTGVYNREGQGWILLKAELGQSCNLNGPWATYWEAPTLPTHQ
jgi:hypothetical protein